MPLIGALVPITERGMLPAMKFSRRGAAPDGDGEVWLVLDESTDAPELVLGVFRGRHDAKEFFDSIDAGEYPDVALGRYDIDWNFRDGTARYTS